MTETYEWTVLLVYMALVAGLTIWPLAHLLTANDEEHPDAKKPSPVKERA